MEKKLYKSETDKKIAGVCGGIAQYFGIDSTWIRLAWALAILFLGTGVVAYIICALVMPNPPQNQNFNGQGYYDGSNGQYTNFNPVDEDKR